MPLDQAVLNGTLMRKVAHVAPAVFSAWVVAQILRVVQRIEAKTTIKSDDEAKEVARELYRAFPTLRIEEMQEVFDGMIFGRFGKYYERLKAAEFIEAFKQHEASEQRVQIFESQHKKYPYAVKVTSTDELREVLRECIKRGYKLRKDHTTKGESKELFLVIDGTVFDYVTETELVTMDAEKFTAPIRYGGEKVEARVMTNGQRLRESLKVDPKIMAQYVQKSNGGLSNE